ncbi:hypothetical protein [Staphylococcus sp. Marseille-Q6910]|uniref:hypothetical protein n=1 Tax=Staphylococcus sp. Marseille-Q6910 TaxID=2937990 RepID=UPI0020406435|nr:hypothetical protein [Staphylococcus sp. Marseille-Q6910]
MNQRNEHVLSSISYLSFFFAPIILPLIVGIVAKGETSSHGFKALLNHILTVVCFYLGILALVGSGPLLQDSGWLFFLVIVIAIILLALTVYLFMMNLQFKCNT